MTSALIPRAEYAALEHCVYLNQASLGLIPRRSTEAMVGFLVGVAQHGNVRLSDAAEEQVLDDLRQAAAVLFDAPVRSVAVVGGASEALGQLGLLTAKAGGEVVLVESEFPSVTYPWLGARERLGMAVKWVVDDPARDLTTTLIEGIHDGTTVVCFSAVQYATGSLVDVGEVVRHAHEVGARVIVDVTQMAGAMSVSLRSWFADALVCSGYKWLSSHGGVALLAVTDELLQSVPHIVGWKGTEQPFEFEPTTLALASSARRFELSTIAYSSAAGLTTSIDLLIDIGLQAIERHAEALARELVAATAPHGWTPFRDLDTPGASHHIVSLRHPMLAAATVQQRLADEHQIVVSSRGDGIRVSLHAYNHSDDVAALAGALEDSSKNATP
ncbi:MAG: cysteine desulfurase / selenocysteine lyase [Gaiellales bacterium]|nr:cysteine desulfurase / selenocysteine lyase [Gaiellales bacterium]